MPAAYFGVRLPRFLLLGGRMNDWKKTVVISVLGGIIVAFSSWTGATIYNTFQEKERLSKELERNKIIQEINDTLKNEISKQQELTINLFSRLLAQGLAEQKVRTNITQLRKKEITSSQIESQVSQKVIIDIGETLKELKIQDRSQLQEHIELKVPKFVESQVQYQEQQQMQE